MDDTAHSRGKPRRKLITRVQKNAFSQTFFVCNEVKFSSKIKARLVSRNLRWLLQILAFKQRSFYTADAIIMRRRRPPLRWLSSLFGWLLYFEHISNPAIFFLFLFFFFYKLLVCILPQDNI
jgi:hypothetical protein